MKDPVLALHSYIGCFTLTDERFRKINETCEFLEDETDKWGGAEGRSGGAMRIGLNYLRKAFETREKKPRVGFYTDVGFEDKGTLIATSGSGKTKEVLEAVRNGGFEKILVLTSKLESPLIKEIKNKKVKHKVVVIPGREDERGDIVSHYEQQIVQGETETMGDLFEENAMFFLYLVGKKLSILQEDSDKKISGHKELGNINENFIKV